MYTCTICGLCDFDCKIGVSISKIIQETKIDLVEQGIAPLAIHKSIIKGIVDNDNSVGGNPQERLDWLPEQYRNDEVFEEKEAENLLFLGCTSSFRVKESAFSSYNLLTKAGLDFKILKNEPYCRVGSGIRGVDKDITIKIGEKLINSTNLGTYELISSSPLCTFNYRYVNYKLKLDKKFTYVTEYLLNSIKY